ncbi:MAG: hypothetical protein WA958_06635 [Tunicatimonas sp.]
MDIESEDLMIIDPNRFQNGKDGPYHNSAERKRFWTDIIRSLHLHLNIIIAEARKENERRKQLGWDEVISDLEERIARVQERNA